ncbi:MAG: glycosyltransferase [Bacteroidaceae bacterium]|nr:glycosyltransferase [Bacteroidaceae bacterium]
MKKILFIETCNYVDYPSGGQLSFARHFAAAMRGDAALAGIRTDRSMLEGEWGKCAVGKYDYDFFNLHNEVVSSSKPVIPKRISAYLSVRKHIHRIIKDRQFDIIIIQAPEVLFALPVSLLDKVCLIMPGVSNPLRISRYRWARCLAGIYDRHFLRCARLVRWILPAADSETIEGFVRRSKGQLDRSRITQFPTRYDSDIFRPMPKAGCRKQLGLGKDDLIVITTGRLNWYKGWKLLVDAFALFVTQHPEARLFFLGEGEDEERIREHIVHRGLSGRTFLPGRLSQHDISSYLNASDLFVMGSYTEGWSTSLVEAVACSKPCVVTDFSSAHDLVKDGENGYVVSSRTATEFASAMDKALSLAPEDIESHARAACSMSVNTLRERLNDILSFK